MQWLRLHYYSFEFIVIFRETSRDFRGK